MVCLGGARRRCRHGLTRRDGPPPHVTLDALGRPAYTRSSYVSEETTMIRRTLGLLVTLALSLLVAPLAADAQQPTNVPRIGMVTGGGGPGDWPIEIDLTPEGFTKVFRQGLRELGYIEGKNILVEYRGAEGHRDRIPGLMAELLHLHVD